MSGCSGAADRRAGRQPGPAGDASRFRRDATINSGGGAMGEKVSFVVVFSFFKTKSNISCSLFLDVDAGESEASATA